MLEVELWADKQGEQEVYKKNPIYQKVMKIAL